MLRRIIDVSKLEKELLNQLKERYPNGYQETDIVRFRNIQNEVIEAVTLKTADTLYLVKINKKLVDTLEGLEKDLDNTRDEDYNNPKENKDDIRKLTDADDAD